MELKCYPYIRMHLAARSGAIKRTIKSYAAVKIQDTSAEHVFRGLFLALQLIIVGNSVPLRSKARMILPFYYSCFKGTWTICNRSVILSM